MNGTVNGIVTAITVAWMMAMSASASAQLLSGDRVDTSGEREAPERIEISPARKPMQRLEPFGSNLFEGGFGSEREDGLTPEYLVQPGDRISLRVRGATSFEGEVVVDGQGNIFTPSLGPVRVTGVQIVDLAEHIVQAARTVSTENVNVYTNLQSTQPTVVFVTGYVENPGSYAGVAFDSVLFFLGRAGGVHPNQVATATSR